MTIEQTLEYIHSVKWTGSKPGLSRTRELLEKLGNPEKDLKFIHIAGTNGKGSTAAMLESILRAAGYKTGLYTSPYIRIFNERMQVGGEYISDMELIELTEIIRPFADTMEDAPTEFELITALAMLYFKRAGVDIVILEVGLGGELDSTNVIDTPELAIICAIGLDHTAELGGTIAEIASAKAGIIKEGGTVVIYGAEPAAVHVFEKKCAEVRAKLIKTDFKRLTVIGSALSGSVIDFGPYKSLIISLAGTYQPKNAALVITAVETLRFKGWRIRDDALKSGLLNVRWPGRFEQLRENPVVILDGAHNPHGVHEAAASLRKLYPKRKIVFLTGVMADKDAKTMMSELVPISKCFITVKPNNPRAMDADKLAGLLRLLGAQAEAAASIKTGVSAAMEKAGKDGVIAAVGSLYFSEDIRQAFGSL